MMLSAFSFLLPNSPVSSTPLGLAFAEASKGVGRTAPNPPVGCVVMDDDGKVLGRGFHARAGERHAEVAALDDVVARHGPGSARGKTLVVTLEPCNHHGRTPPCVDRILHEGVARVVVGALDPNPKVNGSGIRRLREEGVQVAVDDTDDGRRCEALIQPFASVVLRKRPWLILKTATSLDGRVATHTGASRFITGAKSRALVHGLRNVIDAVVVGAHTVLVDDPALTVRDVPHRDGVTPRDPLRVVLDRRLEVSAQARVFLPPGALVFHDKVADPADEPTTSGTDVCRLPVGTDWAVVLEELARRGVLSVMVEAGPRIVGSALRAGVVDELWWFTAPLLIGADGIEAVAPLGVSNLAEAMAFAPVERAVLDADFLSVLRGTVR
jgi:diaminohydroxyphosphoribosylaminopyrimidine deaminase/5-amino-6-(5-phosphoribosylamino)uracil reductase